MTEKECRERLDEGAFRLGCGCVYRRVGLSSGNFVLVRACAEHEYRRIRSGQVARKVRNFGIS